MKKIVPNGRVIKDIREQLTQGATQKEMAYAVGVSVRHLRAIENENAPIPIMQLEKIAGYLRVPKERLAFSIDEPKLVPPPTVSLLDLVPELAHDRIVPRFEEEFAYATMDEDQLFKNARSSQDLKVHMATRLTGETTEYVSETTEILSSLTRAQRNILANITAVEEVAVRKRIRQLLVLLKGNDVWVYECHHYRWLPERFSLPPKDQAIDGEFRLELVFGPPGEYGETSVKVAVDHGQPFFLEGWDSQRTQGS